ncbi:MAG TPA: ATP-binding cassette domain-containing protein [Rhizomicrobium sp.]|jgi:capsular polysaccharide transport system ATP-binding protein|nr:ATP-binding cassette domain-containing protein [Rhizomicrobium sp.]
MIIRLKDIYVPAGSAAARRPLFEGLDLEIPSAARVGVVGGAKSGKTTLLRLMCGTMQPDSGTVERNGFTSWPIPLGSFLTPTATVARNIRFIARLYGILDEEFPRRIAIMVGLEEFLNLPMQNCPKFVKGRLALALGIGLEFDTYLFDGSLAPADKSFKEKAVDLVTARMTGRGYVLATSTPAEAEKHCDSIYVLESGKARHFPDKNQGIEYFKKLLEAEKKKLAMEQQAGRIEEDDEDADGVADVDVVGAAVADVLE